MVLSNIELEVANSKLHRRKWLVCRLSPPCNDECGGGRAPDATFGSSYPLPKVQNVKTIHFCENI